MHHKTFGMVADWSIHNPQPDKDNPKKPANPHAHIMLTLRSLRSNGSWAPKKTSHYELDENGQKVPVIDPETGKQKLELIAKSAIPTSMPTFLPVLGSSSIMANSITFIFYLF